MRARTRHGSLYCGCIIYNLYTHTLYCTYIIYIDMCVYCVYTHKLVTCVTALCVCINSAAAAAFLCDIRTPFLCATVHNTHTHTDNTYICII